MATYLTAYKLPNGEEIAIATLKSRVIDKVDGEDLHLAGEPTAVIVRANESFERSLQKIQSMANSTLNNLKAIQPDELKIEFGITFSADAGVFITLGTEFNIKVELTWKKENNSSDTK